MFAFSSGGCSKRSLRDDRPMPRRISDDKRSRNPDRREKTTGSTRAAKFDRQMSGTVFSSRAKLLWAGIIFLVALLLYSWTLAPTVTLTDSGELIIVAQGLGVAHPPGFPLWVILAHLASIVPFGNVAVRINFSSALFAALASAMLALVVAELMITIPYLLRQKKKSAPQKKKREDPRF